MFGIFRKKLTAYSSSITIYCGISLDQFSPMIHEHLVSDWKERKTSLFPDPRQHNVSVQNAVYINNFYKPLKRQTKIFKNVTSN